ncbi:MAG: undecaprenyldiphospho-muramoylpentapeptide beta-N-acetylglucosaminyltransferase [Prevotella sp.]|nr:undecaprenyldiphospho-muramoylpentapeptide beta-N-acetylglucosaminyltransferase [Prevotella sp.]
MAKKLSVLISGGGTGGHIFPAVAIADAIRRRVPEAKILFVGAEERMEMQRVPAAGYEIIGLPVRGLIRPLYSPRNIGVMIDFLRSRRKVKGIIRTFRPDIAIGVGGYASAPTLNAAAALGIPCLIQEQNSFAGVTNRSLAKKAAAICVAYDGMERFFPEEKLIITGNPVRQGLKSNLTKAAAAAAFGFTGNRPTLLIVGGSLGARTVNDSVLGAIGQIAAADADIIWQTGSIYKEGVARVLEEKGRPKNLFVTEFISDMAAAYAAADLVISRAGASSISELCLLSKPSILVPSPNVAEDHQTHNAMALVNKGAAFMVPDAEAARTLITLALQTVANKGQLQRLGANAGLMARPDAADIIAEKALSLVKD